jgi:DNA polymerase elongation subunit (family B)
MESEKLKIVFDIETSGFPLETFSESQQEYLMRYVEKEKDEKIRSEKELEAIRYLNLYPFTAKVIVIGLMNINTGNRYVIFESEEPREWESEEKKISYHGMTEEKMLIKFWDFLTKADKLISFNGRQFDLPFLMLRSAMLKIRPSRNFIKSRYDITKHIDLLDQFTFYGLTRKFNLDFYAHAFGLESPKSNGITGMDVNELYRAGKIEDIAIYCGDDIKATAELYEIWKTYLKF